MRNIWLLRSKFPVGTKVKIVPTGNAAMDFAAGKFGEVTNVDINIEMIGVYFGGGPKWVAGPSWNEFFEFQLQVI